MSNYFKQNSRFGTLNEEIKELKKDDRKTKDKKIEDKKCIHCNTTYSKKSCLDRHIKNSKCSIYINEIKKQKQLEDLKTEINKLKLQMSNQNKPKLK